MLRAVRTLSWHHRPGDSAFRELGGWPRVQGTASLAEENLVPLSEEFLSLGSLSLGYLPFPPRLGVAGQSHALAGNFLPGGGVERSSFRSTRCIPENSIGPETSATWQRCSAMLCGRPTRAGYALDAGEAGNERLAEFFREVQETHATVAGRAEEMLGGRGGEERAGGVGQGCVPAEGDPGGVSSGPGPRCVICGGSAAVPEPGCSPACFPATCGAL